METLPRITQIEAISVQPISDVKERAVGQSQEVIKTHPPLLTPRQHEILVLASNGLKSREIGDLLGLSVKAVDNYRSNIRLRLDALNTAEAVTKVSLFGDRPELGNEASDHTWYSGPFVRPLNMREKEVLERVAEGLPSKIIASRLGVTVRAVENCRSRIFLKLGAFNSAHAVNIALQLGVIGELSTLPPPHSQPKESKKEEPKDKLSQREKEVLFHSVMGQSAKQIAGIFRIAQKTIENHTANIRKRYGASSTVHALVKALIAGDISIEDLKQNAIASVSHDTDTPEQTENKTQLSARRKEVLLLAALGNTSKEIAALLGIAPKTVENHRSAILMQLNAFSMKEALVKALMLEEITLDDLQKPSEQDTPQVEHTQLVQVRKQLAEEAMLQPTATN